MEIFCGYIFFHLQSIYGLEIILYVFRRSPGEGKGYSLQYSGLENFMDCIVRGVAKSRTRLSDLNFLILRERVACLPVSQISAVTLL